MYLTSVSDVCHLLLMLVILLTSRSVGGADENNGSDTTISDPIILPNLPLAKNPFADDTILSLDLARETVVLAGRFLYQVVSEEEVLQKLPEKYTFHSWRDVGSTETLIVSTETTPEEAGKIIVAFRGTDNTADGDWLTNINIPKVPFGPAGKEMYATTVVETLNWLTGGIKNSTISVKVHRGFNEVFSDNLYEHIMEVLESERLLGRLDAEGNLYYNSTVHFMGHSLGGANAQLMGTYFAHFHPKIQTYITTLGAPRTGNLAFKVLAESLPNLSTWRLVFCHDIVPRIPNVKYYHAGHLMHYGCGMEDDATASTVGAYYRHAGDTFQNYAGVPFALWSVPSSVGGRMFSDHLGGQYLAWLDSAAASEEGLQSNWSSTFASEMMGEEQRRLEAQDEQGTNQDYGQILQQLKAQGLFQGLRGFPIAN